MNLTGQAKEEFEKWLFGSLTFDYCEDYNEWFRLTDLSMQYGVLVDWFDSVGIYIDVHKVFNLKEYRWWIEDDSLMLEDFQSEAFNSRPQARAKAIEKANEIFNNR